MRQLFSKWMAVALAVVQESRSCSVTVTTDEQYLHGRPTVSSSDASASSTCGSVLHPWHLEAPAGQRINISLLDFAGSANYRSRDDNAVCRRYGYIVEKSSKKNVSICAVALIDGKSHSVKVQCIFQTQTAWTFYWSTHKMPTFSSD